MKKLQYIYGNTGWTTYEIAITRASDNYVQGLISESCSAERKTLSEWTLFKGDTHWYEKLLSTYSNCTAYPICDENQTLDTSVTPPICVDDSDLYSKNIYTSCLSTEWIT
ncbi:MAG: hypothetical protein Q9M36_03015 [Sulfurovum sp.]|nr:hypothetical protein [Sulfurovum sp.]